MKTIPRSTVMDALRILGVTDPEDVRDVHLNYRAVTVTRFNKVDGKLHLDASGGNVLVEHEHRIVGEDLPVCLDDAGVQVGTTEDEPETPEQSAAIVDDNLRRMGSVGLTPHPDECPRCYMVGEHAMLCPADTGKPVAEAVNA